MHTIQEIRAEFSRLDKLLFIDTSTVEIVFSKRAVTRYGSCRCKKTISGTWFPVRVTISDFLREGDDVQFWDTVRHEYAHAAAAILTGKNCGHDKTWKAICRKVGCSGDVRAESNAASRKRARDAAKYAVTCLGCGSVTLYIRKGEIVKRLESGKNSGVRCTVCGGREFKLTYR